MKFTGLVLTVVVLVFGFFSSIDATTPDQDITGLEDRIFVLEEQVQMLADELTANVVMDCVNENMLRGVYMAPKVNAEECIGERLAILESLLEAREEPASYVPGIPSNRA